jgi:hypothetical protein
MHQNADQEFEPQFVYGDFGITCEIFLQMDLPNPFFPQGEIVLENLQNWLFLNIFFFFFRVICSH